VEEVKEEGWYVLAFWALKDQLLRWVFFFFYLDSYGKFRCI
jgi:hypothetical protein